jgi:hypothetical protein
MAHLAIKDARTLAFRCQRPDAGTLSGPLPERILVPGIGCLASDICGPFASWRLTIHNGMQICVDVNV